MEQATTMKLIPIIIAILATPSDAGDRAMSAAEFEAAVTGRTLSYALGGRAYGIEEYLRNRRVRWSFLAGACHEGSWFPDGENICFVYETLDSAQCWQFFDHAGDLSAVFQGDGTTTELFDAQDAGEKLECLGPKIGV